MGLFRVILLVFILILPVKANTIYQLIKIPNLEIYELNTPNKLKYFYASKPFKLGVKKNIVCFNSDRKTLDQKYQIINKNLNRYSANFLKKINLKYIVLCENLSISEINTGGIPDNIMKTLILDIKFNENYFERIIHHEVFHIINDSYKSFFNKEEWINFNNKDFKYAECSTCSKRLGLDTYINTEGFLTEYSKSTASEDMAEVFSHLILKINKSKVDPILQKKRMFIRNNILKIDNNFKFWLMIKKIKASKSEKIILFFLILLGFFVITSFVAIKDKCLFVKNHNPKKINFKNPENIAILNAPCGNVIIELYPNISPNAVTRFKTLIRSNAYDNVAFHRVIVNKLVQAGDLEFGEKNKLNYGKIGTGKSGLGTILSELDGEFKYTKGSVGLARTFKNDTEDSQFFITLQDEPLFEGEYTPVGKVIYGLEVLKKIKYLDNSEYVLRPDFINTFKMLN